MPLLFRAFDLPRKTTKWRKWSAAQKSIVNRKDAYKLDTLRTKKSRKKGK